MPLKDKLLVELTRAATVWNILITTNKICFNNIQVPSVKEIDNKIISLTSAKLDKMIHTLN